MAETDVARADGGGNQQGAPLVLALAATPSEAAAHRDYADGAQFDELNRNAPPATLVMRKGVEIKTPERDDPTLISFAWGTPRCVYELDHFLAEANNKKCLWDVGAFHGVYSLSFCAADPSRQSLAFEPSPLGFEKLQANVKANPNLQIRPFCAAIGDRCGELAMSYEWQHLVADPNADVPAKESGDKAMKVPLLTIDRIYEEQGIAPDIVKIDVEGFEYHVIQGAAHLESRSACDLHGSASIDAGAARDFALSTMGRSARPQLSNLAHGRTRAEPPAS